MPSLRTSFLLVSALCGAVSVHAQTTLPSEYECRFADGPITIDGKADEPAWQHAQVIDHFLIPGQPASKRPRTATKARLLWDRQYLYFFAEMEDHDLFADVTEHDGMCWLNDVFELFLKPAADKDGYYEFEVNAANATLDMFIPKRSGDMYAKRKSADPFEFKTAVVLDGTLNQRADTDRGWAVEGRLRWQDFSPTGGRPAPGEKWKFAFCRYDYDTHFPQPELTSSASLGKMSFHQYEDYSTLRFAAPEAPRGQAQPFGIERRTLLTSSRVIGSPEPPLPYKVQRAYPKLDVFQPLYIAEEPGTDDLLILQHLSHWGGPGKLLRARNDPNVSSYEVVLPIDGLPYGFCFHPDFLHNGYIYILYNGPMAVRPRNNRISRFTIDRKTRGIDPASELVYLEWDSNGHNGGEPAFGPDGYLYCSTGDGSNDSDTDLRGQDITHLNSTMIRIDVDHPDAATGRPYSIPKDNPFLNTPGARPEIYAYGFRNPWRMCFDEKTGQLWVGQNGQDLWEQVYVVQRGANYGWSLYEGSHPFKPNRKQGPTPISPPTIEHPHSEFRSLTGGVVYYGDKFPDLRGHYLYGDFSTGRIWAAKHDGSKVVSDKEIARTTLQIVNFRALRNGDVLVLDDGSGIYKLVATPKEAVAHQPPFPRKLSETGLFASTRDHVPAPGLIPYTVNSPLWSDGAIKERFIAIPGDGKIELTPARGWNFPDGTVLVKTFSLELDPGKAASRRRLETRLFTRQMGQWAGYTYVWNDEQTDATLAPAAGLDRTFEIRDPSADGGARKQTWHFPSRTECLVCHSRAANFVLGPSTLQMNKVHEYGGVSDNQLRTLEHLGMFQVNDAEPAKKALRREGAAAGLKDEALNKWVEGRLPATDQRQYPSDDALLPVSPVELPAIPDPFDKNADLNLRARSYLQANCAICHIEAGGGNSLMDLEFTTPPDKTRLFDVPPEHDTFGLPNARLISPGHPESSVLLYRLIIRGNGQMPPLASNASDARAIRLLTEWIKQMPPTNSASAR